MDKIENRATTKDIELNGRKFRIGKFDAFTGSYIAYTLMAEMMPGGLNKAVGAPQSNTAKKMSREDFSQLQKDCLNICAEVLPAGKTPIIDDSGKFAVIGLENDTATVLTLTIQVLIFNVTSFFDESLLASIAEAMSGMSLPGAPT